MSVREYIGARYVPLFADPYQWDRNKTYEPLTIVYNEGNSYTSRQYVPSGIDIINEAYWALTGNYNAQVEQYRREVADVVSSIEGFQSLVYDETRARETADGQIREDLSAETSARESADASLEQNLAVETTARESADTALQNNVREISDLIISSGWVNGSLIKDGAVSDVKLAEDVRSKILKGTIVDCIEPYYVGDIVAYNGKFYGTGTDQPAIAQGGCFNGSEYVYVLRNEADTSAKIATSNESANTWNILTTTYSGMGHCNCMAFDGSRYYVYSDYSTGTITVLNTTFSVLKTLQAPTSMYGGIGYDKKTHKMWFVTYQGEIFQLDTSTDTFTKMDYELSETVTTSDNIGNTGQGFAVYDDIFVFPVGGTPRTGFRVYNALNGQHIKDVSIPYYTMLYPFTEPEDCDFDEDGTLYVHTLASNASDSSTRYAWGAFLWKTNIFKGSMTQMFTGSANYLGGEFFLEHSANYNGFKSTGWQNETPFKDMLEASIALNNPTMQHKRLNVCVNTPYSNTNAQTLNGSMYLEGVNTTIVSNSSGNKTWNGCLSLRGRCNITLLNRFEIRGARDMPFNYLIRVTDSRLSGNGINGYKGNLSGGYTMRIENDCMVYLPYITLDGASTTPVTNNLLGFGYVLGSPHNGS